MNYKMIVSDLDDTLLREDLTISEATKNILIQAQQKGIKVVLASGRPTVAMERYAKELQLKEYGGYMISYNGAVITDCTHDKITFEQNLQKSTVHELYHFSKEENVFIHTYKDGNIITPQTNKYTTIESDLTGMPIKQTEDFIREIDKDVIKVILLEDPEYLKTVEKNLKEKFEHKMSITISKPFFLECMDKGVDKGDTLKFLSEQLGIKSEEILALGDSYNDVKMLKFAGLGVAMKNAPQDIKELVDYVTESNMNDGIVEAMKKFVFN